MVESRQPVSVAPARHSADPVVEAVQQSPESPLLPDHRFRELAEILPVIVWMVSPDWQRVEYVNPAFTQIYGHSKEELAVNPMLWIDAIHPEDRDRVLDFYRAHHGRRTDQEYRIIDASGRVRWIRDVTTPICDPDGSLRHLAGFAEDISDRVRARRDLERSLQHTELLVREIHHRVKNNLQIISGLLEIVSDADSDTRQRELLENVRARIRAMAVVHDHLIAGDNPVRVAAPSFFESIVGHLHSAWTPRGGPISVTLAIADLELSTDTAVPCGLILCELVSNAFKHAFVGHDEPSEATVHVRLFRRSHHSLVLEVSDNGHGLPPELDWRHTPTIGLQLVDSMVRQLHARMQVMRDRGTTFAISFENCLRD